MQAYQGGDNLAFEEIYRRYSGKAYAYISKRLFNRNEMDDLLQAIFLKLHKSRHLYSNKFLFAPWLFTISRSVLLDHIKIKKSEKATESNQIEQHSSTDSIASTEPIVNALHELSESQLKALEMRYRQGLDFSQIAERLQTSSGNVRQLISRAVRKLRRSI